MNISPVLHSFVPFNPFSLALFTRGDGAKPSGFFFVSRTDEKEVRVEIKTKGDEKASRARREGEKGSGNRQSVLCARGTTTRPRLLLSSWTETNGGT